MYSDDTNSDSLLNFGEVATYQCDHGYVQNGGDGKRTCIGDDNNSTGDWNGTAPTCSGTFNNYFN